MIDIGLPELDGYEVARRVRAANEHAVVLVAMTGRSVTADQDDAMTAGFDTYMTKPVNTARLHRMLETAETDYQSRFKNASFSSS